MTAHLQLLTAFAGGLFGAGFGGLNAFMLCGFLAVIGSSITFITGDASFSALIPWGPFLGPQVAFNGAVAAAALAARRGLLLSGRDVVTPLYGLNRPSLLLTGGVFGVLGQALKLTLESLPQLHGIPLVNPIAMSIVISGFLVRLLFGRSTVMGTVGIGEGRWKKKRDENWHPWLGHPLSVLLTAMTVSLFSGIIALLLPRSTGLAFGLGALTLGFLYTGAKIPVILHIAWASEYAVLLTGDIAYGLFCGILAALLAELGAGLFLLKGDTHIDPPSLAVAASFSLGPLLAVMTRNGMPAVLSWILTSFMALVLLLVLSILQTHRERE